MIVSPELSKFLPYVHMPYSLQHALFKDFISVASAYLISEHRIFWQTYLYVTHMDLFISKHVPIVLHWPAPTYGTWSHDLIRFIPQPFRQTYFLLDAINKFSNLFLVEFFFLPTVFFLPLPTLNQLLLLQHFSKF